VLTYLVASGRRTTNGKEKLNMSDDMLALIAIGLSLLAICMNLTHLLRNRRK